MTQDFSLLVIRARAFAVGAHAARAQRRNYTGEYYHEHLEQVADMVRNAGGTPEMEAAAWLHDVLEDTAVLPDLLRSEFGDTVTDLVIWLTDVSYPGMGNRAVRKAADRDHIAAAPAAAQTIKLADSISNVQSIAEYDVAFARVYLQEKRELLAVLTQGDADLQSLLGKLLDHYQGVSNVASGS